MRPSKSGFLISLLLVAAACTFVLDEPTGITREITPITPTGSISLTDYIAVDTIYLFINKTFTFSIKGDVGNTPFTGEAYFNEALFYTFNSRQGQFNIPDSHFKTGNHKLKLSFKEPLNDGSLISRFTPLEATIFREWVVVIDVDPPPDFEIATANVNGYLKYTWPEYKKADFINYEIEAYTSSGYKRLAFDTPSRNSYFDSTYMDGNGESSIRVTMYTTHGSVDSYTFVNEPAITYSMVFHPEDTTASFEWSKPKYYGPFKSYTISDELSTLANITTVNDTNLTLKINGIFPSITQIHFRMVDKSGVDVFHKENNIDFFMGNAIPPPSFANSWYYSKSANQFIGKSGATINIYDGSFHFITSRTTESGLTYAMTVAWPGTYLHYIGSDTKISQLNLVNGNEKFMHITGTYIPEAYISAVSGAENQVVSFTASDNDHIHFPIDIKGLVDMQTTTVLQDNNDHTTQISDDGRYSFSFPDVYLVSGGTQTLIGAIPNNYYFRWFRGDNTDEVITTHYAPNVIDELKTVIVRSSDMAILRTFDPPEAGFRLTSYDPATKTLLYTKFGAVKVYFINIETGSKKAYNARGSFYTPLLNGVLIIGGRYIKAL